MSRKNSNTKERIDSLKEAAKRYASEGMLRTAASQREKAAALLMEENKPKKARKQYAIAIRYLLRDAKRNVEEDPASSYTTDGIIEILDLLDNIRKIDA